MATDGAARGEPGRLAARLQAAGAIRSRRWAEAFAAVPRHLFVPRIYTGPGADGGYEPLDAGDPRWLAAVYADEPLPVQIGDGGTWLSSSSQPSLMARMLEALEVTGEERVLEIGTGTGYNAALLCEGLGSDRVVSVDIDPALTEAARGRLRRLGYSPVLAAADGAGAYPAAAPYDRIIATCSLPRLPAAWISQTAGDGLILLNLYRELGGGALAMLHVRGGRATGHFAPFSGGFMPTRTLAVTDAGAAIGDHAGQDGTRTETPLAAGVLADDGFRVLAALRMPGVHKIGLLPDGEPEQTWLVADDGSWAWQADGEETATQGGPQPLWTCLEGLYRDWADLGRPGREEFGLTVTPDGKHRLWCGNESHGGWFL